MGLSFIRLASSACVEVVAHRAQGSVSGPCERTEEQFSDSVRALIERIHRVQEDYDEVNYQKVVSDLMETAYHAQKDIPECIRAGRADDLEIQNARASFRDLVMRAYRAQEGVPEGMRMTEARPIEDWR